MPALGMAEARHKHCLFLSLILSVCLSIRPSFCLLECLGLFMHAQYQYSIGAVENREI